MLAAATAGCDVEEPGRFAESRGLDTPPLVLGVVEAIVVVDEDSGATELMEIVRGEELQNVIIGTSLRLHFNRFLLPATANRQSICVHPSDQPIGRSEDCTEPNQPHTLVEIDPVRRRVSYRFEGDNRLVADTRYRLTVFAPVDDEAPGLRAFDGAPLFQLETFDFRTAVAGPADADPAPSTQRYCDSLACFAACEGDPDEDGCRAPCALQVDSGPYQPGSLRPGGTLFSGCAFANCHGPDPTATIPSAVIAMGLDLSDEGLFATAVGMTAHHSQQGQTPTLGEQSPQRFGRAMPIVDPGSPANSYLMYKILANPLNYADVVDDGALDPQLASEIARLRASVITGLPMPAESTPTGGPIGFLATPADSERRMETVGSWIAHGAVNPADCP